MNSTRVSSRRSAGTSLWMAIIYGNIRTTHMTSAISSHPRSSFPIAWNNSKISGWSIRVNVPNYHGIAAFFTASGVAARFFSPQVGGGGAGPTIFPAFRIDHDQKFQQTTHVQYQPQQELALDRIQLKCIGECTLPAGRVVETSARKVRGGNGLGLWIQSRRAARSMNSVPLVTTVSPTAEAPAHLDQPVDRVRRP